MGSKLSYSRFNKIATAVAFSPRAEAILCESKAISEGFSASLLLIHIGLDIPETRKKLKDLCVKVGLLEGSYELVFHPGMPVDSIVTACNDNNVDLLIAGALTVESFWQFYFGSIARKLSRNVNCSILLLTNPSTKPKPFEHIVVNGLSNVKTMRTINTAIEFAKQSGSKLLEIVREVKRGKMPKVEDDETLEKLNINRDKLLELEQRRLENIQEHLVDFEGIEVNCQCVIGKAGYTIGHYTQAKRADLLVVNSPDRKLSFFDRLFPHDIEWILADMPSSMLIVR